MSNPLRPHSSVPFLNVEPDINIWTEGKEDLDGFMYKPKKQRAPAKTNTLITPRINQSCSTPSFQDQQARNKNRSETHLKIMDVTKRGGSAECYSPVVEKKKLGPRERFTATRFKAKGASSLGLFHRKQKSPTKVAARSINSESNMLVTCGFLSHKDGKRFKRRWISLTTDLIRIYDAKITEKLDKVDSDPITDISLSYAAVKDNDDSSCFSLVTPDKIHFFQAESDAECIRWKDMIKDLCNNIVMNSINSDGDKHHHEPLSSDSEDDTTLKFDNPEIRWMSSANRCADCSDTNPEWTSVNLGIFICLECSGVHRSFGTHISQVKSVRLDKWTPEQIEAMKQLGNEKSNAIWEQNVPEQFSRINSRSSREERVTWLTLKYVTGRFREDYVPSGPKMISSKGTKQEEIKMLMLDSLREDEDFRSRCAAALFTFCVP